MVAFSRLAAVLLGQSHVLSGNYVLPTNEAITHTSSRDELSFATRRAKGTRRANPARAVPYDCPFLVVSRDTFPRPPRT